MAITAAVRAAFMRQIGKLEQSSASWFLLLLQSHIGLDCGNDPFSGGGLAMKDEAIIEALATKVMGWKLCSYEGEMDYTPNDWTPNKAQRNDGWYWDGRPNDEAWQWNPLTNPADSKQVREKLAESWPHYHLERYSDGRFRFTVIFVGNEHTTKSVNGPMANTEERAVALCALKTVEVNVE